MEHREAEDWRIAVRVAEYAPSTGVVPMRCATALAVNAELDRLRTELLAAQEAAKRWRGIAEVARELANSSSRIGGIAARLGLGA